MYFILFLVFRVFQALNKQIEVGRKVLEISDAAKNNGTEGGLVLWRGLDVFVLHPLNVLNGPLPISLGLLKSLAANLLILWGEKLLHHQIVAGDEPAKAAYDNHEG